MRKTVFAVLTALVLAPVASAQTAPATTVPATTASATTAPAAAAHTAGVTRSSAPMTMNNMAKINVNSAPVADLTKIPGVSAKVAAEIVKNRPYKNSAELVKKVKGVGSKNVLKMIPVITF